MYFRCFLKFDIDGMQGAYRHTSLALADPCVNNQLDLGVRPVEPHSEVQRSHSVIKDRLSASHCTQLGDATIDTPSGSLEYVKSSQSPAETFGIHF